MILYIRVHAINYLIRLRCLGSYFNMIWNGDGRKNTDALDRILKMVFFLVKVDFANNFA